jgi:dephospho-CoA kinase
MKSNLYIGLSGGIASGKTIVSDEFSSLGVDIIDTDIIARELIFPGSETLNEIVSIFGENVLQDDGNLNRKLMRQIIFNEKDKKITLEKIMHPRIQNEVKLKIQSVSGRYQIIVVPLLLQSPILDFVHRVLIIDCDEKIQINRLIKRDNITEELAKKMIENQSKREERLAIADDIILNEGRIEEIKHEVKKLNDFYIKISSS